MKSERTAKELANKVRELYLASLGHVEERAEELATFLGVELAPERAKEEWPSGWGEPARVNAAGNVYLGEHGCLLLTMVGACDEPVRLNRRALVAAYEAARKAGVLPGLEAKAEPAAPERPTLPGWSEMPVHASNASADYIRLPSGATQPLSGEGSGQAAINRAALVEIHRRWLAAKRELERWADCLGAISEDELPSTHERAKAALAILCGEEVR